MINIPKEYKEFYEKNGYFISKGHKIFGDNYKYLLDFSRKIGNPIPFEDENSLTKDIKVNLSGDLDSPATGNIGLGLHTDTFFRNDKFKAKVGILFCINPGNGKGGNTLISNIKKTIEEYGLLYGEEEKNKILNTKLYFSEKENIYKFGNIKVKIFQDFTGGYKNTTLYSNGIFNITDNIQRDNNLKKFGDLLDKNSIVLPILEKGDIIVMNNTTYVHGRLGNFGNDRHLVRVQIN